MCSGLFVKHSQKNKKIPFKIFLDNPVKKWYNDKAVERGSGDTGTEGSLSGLREKKLTGAEKSSGKGIDKLVWKWYNRKADARKRKPRYHRKEDLKKEKNEKKYLTNWKRSDIIKELLHKKRQRTSRKNLKKLEKSTWQIKRDVI